MRNAAANIHHTAAVPITRHRHVATRTMAAAVNIRSTAAARTKLQQRKDRNSKDVDANTINSVAVLMVLRLHKDHMAMAVIVRNVSTNAVLTELRLPLDPISKDVHAPPVNMAAAPMASPMHKDHTSMAATTFRLPRKKLAVSRKMAALAAITRLNTSSIWNMAVARVSGTAAAVATTIATIQLKTANRRAKLRPERMRAYCRKSMGHALATIPFTTTIRIAMLARNSFMAAAWATPIDSKPSTNVKNCAKSTIRCVSGVEKSDCLRFSILIFRCRICHFPQHLASNRWKLDNVTDDSNVGIMTKNKTLALHSHMADAKATRTILRRKKHAAINASDQDLAKVSERIIDCSKFLVCGFWLFFFFNFSGLISFELF